MEHTTEYKHPIHLPLQILVTPAKVWQQLAAHPGWLWALLMHWLMAVIGGIIVYEPSQELLLAIGWTRGLSGLTAASIITSSIFSMIGLLLAATAASFLGLAITRTIGIRANLTQLYTWVLFSFMPVATGMLLGKIQFAIIRPLASTPDAALAYLIKPFSLNPAMFLTSATLPLSFGWFVFSYLDLFGIWTLWLLVLGAGQIFKPDKKQKFWLITELVLLFLAVITGLWNITQFTLLQLAG